LNTQEVFWYLTGHAYWHQHVPPEPYKPSVQKVRDGSQEFNAIGVYGPVEGEQEETIVYTYLQETTERCKVKQHITLAGNINATISDNQLNSVGL
jgi:hypothetical protein